MAPVNKNFKRVFLLLLALLFSTFFSSAFALPFNIVPMGSLPTSVPAGTTVDAAYTVTNNTGEQRNNNFVQFLPPNVSIGAGGCGAGTFNLAPSGQAGDSCILNLVVSGPVNAADTNPENHLFVCFPAGLTCAGTYFPLNVTLAPPLLTAINITPTAPSIPAGLTQQFTAMGTFSDGSMSDITSSVTWNSDTPSVATINSAGLATGVSTGSANITATSGSITSNTAVLTVTAAILTAISITPTSANITASGQQQFTATGNFSDGTTQNYTQMVTWNSATTSVATITTGLVSGNGLATAISLGTSQITATYPPSFTSNSATLTVAAFAYIANKTGDTVSNCVINTDGSLGACTTAGSSFNTPIGVAQYTPTSTPYVYVANNSNSTISQCSINPNDGTFSTCPTLTISGSASVSGPLGITIYPSGPYAYIVNGGDNTVIYCTILSDGTFGTCSTAGSGFASPVDLAIATTNSNAYAYVTDNSNNAVYVCPIEVDGTFGTCVEFTEGGDFNLPSGIAINSAATFAFIANNSNTSNTVYACAITGSGASLGTCTATGSGFSTPFGIAINGAGTLAYITNGSLTTASYCQLSGGTLSNCNVTGSGFSTPGGIYVP